MSDLPPEPAPEQPDAPEAPDAPESFAAPAPDPDPWASMTFGAPDVEPEADPQAGLTFASTGPASDPWAGLTFEAPMEPEPEPEPIELEPQSAEADAEPEAPMPAWSVREPDPDEDDPDAEPDRRGYAGSSRPPRRRRMSPPPSPDPAAPPADATTAPVMSFSGARSTPGDAPEGDAAAVRPDPMRKAVGIGGIVLLVVAALLAVFTIMGGGMPASDRPAQVDDDLIRVPVRTPQPATDDPTGAPGSADTGTPTGPHELRGRAQVVDAMLAVMQDADRTARLTISGTFRANGTQSGMYGAFLVAGQAMKGRLTLTMPKQALALEMVYLDGLVYVRRDGAVGSWVSEYVPEGSSSGFGDLRPSDIEKLKYDGVIEREGRRLHRFHLADERWRGLSRVYPVATTAELKQLDMEVLVDDYGRIVSQTVDARMSVRNGTRSVPLSVALMLRYGRFDEPVVTGPPES